MKARNFKKFLLTTTVIFGTLAFTTFPIASKLHFSTASNEYHAHYTSYVDTGSNSGYSVCGNTSILFSNSTKPTEGLAALYERGIAFNKNPINSIQKIKISFQSYTSTKVYCGNNLLSDELSYDVTSSNFEVNFQHENVSFVTICSEVGETVIDDIEIYYSCSKIYENSVLPEVFITTELNIHGNPTGIISKDSYVSGTISINDDSNSDNNLAVTTAKFKRRGNSTNAMPKKNYRIKLDKKASLFGLTKAKNWVLLADYMDASKMHNYIAYSLSSIIREGHFTPNPHHVRLYIDDVDCGIYLCMEHPDEKEGRLGFGVNDYLNETDFSNLEWMVEFDNNVVNDEEEVLDETYFTFKVDTLPRKYVALKYPEKEDFYEIADDESSFNEEKYLSFFNYVKETISDMSYSLGHMNSRYELANDVCDLQSLASYGLVDLFMLEQDHADHSFKAYKKKTEKIKFGPVWDYDSVVMGLPFANGYVTSPYTDGNIDLSQQSTEFKENFSKNLLATTNGFGIFRDIWNSKKDIIANAFINDMLAEINNIQELVLEDCSLWMPHEEYVVFDNTRYVKEFLNKRISYLNSYFA